MTLTTPTPDPPDTAPPTAADPPPRETVVLRKFPPARPSYRMLHQPFTNRWPPLRCRLGWHRWLGRDVLNRRPADGGVAGRELCTCVSRCAGCDVVRHEQNVALPRGRWVDRS